MAGLDTAVTARHHIAIREIFEDGTEQLSRFTVDPTLAGLESLSRRLAALPVPVTAVVEPTSMTWLALTLAAERWPHLRSLASARAATLTAVVAAHTSDVGDTPVRAAAVRDAAMGWARFWDGHLDLDALAVDVTEHLADLREARAGVERFTAHSRQWWEHLWGDDPLVLSLPGVVPATGPCIRAHLGDGTGFDSAKKAAS